MKNWFVSIEQKKKSGKVSDRTSRRKKSSGGEVKKTNRNTLENSVKYLLNDKHQNHKLTEITDLGNARLTRDYILDSYDDMKEKHGKGLSNIASSFVLSLPADLYHPSVNEWEEISNMTIKNFVSGVNKDLEKKEKAHIKKSMVGMSERQIKEHHLNTDRFAQRLDFDEVKRLSTSVIHDDRNKPLIVGSTSGSHLNIVMSNIHNGEVIKYISQKGGVQAMKTAYSNAVKSTLGLDCEKYIPYSSRPENDKLTSVYDGDLSHLNVVKIDNNTPHKDKILGPIIIDSTQTTPNQNKPFWLATKEKAIFSQAENDKLEEEKQKFKTDKNEKITELKSKVKEIKTARKDIKNDNDKIRDERSNISFKEKELEFKNEEIEKKNKKLNKKSNLIDKSILLFEQAQKTFKDWLTALRSDQKKELEQFAIATANNILEMEVKQPVKAKQMTIAAKIEEEKESLLNEFSNESKVSYQVETRREKNKNKRGGNRM